MAQPTDPLPNAPIGSDAVCLSLNWSNGSWKCSLGSGCWHHRRSHWAGGGAGRFSWGAIGVARSRRDRPPNPREGPQREPPRGCWAGSGSGSVCHPAQVKRCPGGVEGSPGPRVGCWSPAVPRIGGASMGAGGHWGPLREKGATPAPAVPTNRAGATRGRSKKSWPSRPCRPRLVGQGFERQSGEHPWPRTTVSKKKSTP